MEVDVTLKEVTIPAQETTYWCHIQKLDDFIQQKHHIVQFEPLISNEDIVHHMEVFHCETDVDVEIPLYNGDCNQLPEEAKICNRVISLWAMGANAFTYPKEAGLPIGGANYNPFIRLEVHFNNPELKSGKRKLIKNILKVTATNKCTFISSATRSPGVCAFCSSCNRINRSVGHANQNGVEA